MLFVFTVQGETTLMRLIYAWRQFSWSQSPVWHAVLKLNQHIWVPVLLSCYFLFTFLYSSCLCMCMHHCYESSKARPSSWTPDLWHSFSEPRSRWWPQQAPVGQARVSKGLLVCVCSFKRVSMIQSTLEICRCHVARAPVNSEKLWILGVVIKCI